MPRRYKKKKNFKRRRYNRKRKAGPTSLRLNPRQTLVPDRYFAKLNYSDINTVTTNTALTTAWRGNGLYDPEQPLGGQQPLGFDQLMTLYKRFRVHASEIRLQITVRQPSSGSPVPFLVTLRPATTTVSLGRLPETESEYCRWRISPGSMTKAETFRHKMLTKKVFGVPDIKEDDYTGDVSVDPVLQWYWLFGISSMDGLTNQTYDYMWSIVYSCEFYERKDILDQGTWTDVPKPRITVKDDPEKADPVKMIFPRGAKCLTS